MAAILAGCGGGESGLTADTYDDRVLDAMCQTLVECDRFEDVETCVAAMGDTGFNGSFATIAARVEAGTIQFDAAQAEQCLEAIESQGCTWAEAVRAPIACGRVYNGTLGAGEPCVSEHECTGGACEFSGCGPGTACCVGTCASANPQPIGGPCFSDVECSEGLFCPIVGPAADTCQSLGRDGDECWDVFGCERGLLCMGFDPSTDTAGSCAVPPGTGEACSTDELVPCNNLDETCDPVSTTCVPLAAVGEPCVIDEDCVAEAACRDDACEMKGRAGDPCSGDGTFPPCQDFLSCAGGQCAPPPPPETCSP